MKKKMGIALIIIGTLSIVFGIFLVSSGKKQVQENNILPEAQQQETCASGEVESLAAFQQTTTITSVSTDFDPSESQLSGTEERRELDAGKGGVAATDNASGSTVDKAETPVSKSELVTVGKDAGQEAKQKGNDFEGFMADVLKANNIRLKEWNQGTTSPNGAYAENELNPDFLVAHRDDKLEYWVECKYRSALPAKGFSLDEAQLARYHKIQGRSKKKVLIALGVGGSAASPENFYVIPIDSLVRFKFVGPKFLPSYALKDPKDSFKGHVKDWFYKVVFKRNNE